ncbi:hypothetical protein [Pseudomonas putida]|nr:hypothetical protein [Pseudomonas putida]MDD1988065.1 hypothetical protein [Pseudomonas putida]
MHRVVFFAGESDRRTAAPTVICVGVEDSATPVVFGLSGVVSTPR